MITHTKAVISESTIFADDAILPGVITAQDWTDADGNTGFQIYIRPLLAIPNPTTSLEIVLDDNDIAQINALLRAQSIPSNPSDPLTQRIDARLIERVDALVDQVRAEAQGSLAAFKNIDEMLAALNARPVFSMHQQQRLDDIEAKLRDTAHRLAEIEVQITKLDGATARVDGRLIKRVDALEKRLDDHERMKERITILEERLDRRLDRTADKLDRVWETLRDRGVPLEVHDAPPTP